ncbi:GHKL domain-containing protein [Lachnospiraceae bacterium ZAX-1]
MSFIYSILKITLNTLILYFPLVNTLVYPLKRRAKPILLFFIAAVLFFLAEPLGQNISYIAVGGGLLLIALDSEEKILNVACALIGYLVTVCTDYIVLILLDFGFSLDVNTLATKYSLSFMLSFCILLFFITKFLSFILKNTIGALNGHFPKHIAIHILLIMVLCVILFIFNFAYNETLGYAPTIIYFNGTIFILYTILTFIVMHHAIKAAIEEEKSKNKMKHYESINNYTLQLETLYTQMRAFKHDNTNILQTLYAYIENSSSEELKCYYREKVIPYYKDAHQPTIKFDELGKIKCLEIKSILSAKLLSASLKELVIKFDVIEPIDNFYMDTIPLSRIIGIYLDNAIEASVHSKERLFDVGVIHKTDSILIVIGNSTNEDAIPLEKIFQKGYSSKGNDRGLGLYNTNNLLSKQKNVVCKTTFQNKYFTQYLEIFKTPTV